MQSVICEDAIDRNDFMQELEKALGTRQTIDHPIMAELEQHNVPLIRLGIKQTYQITKWFARYIAALYYYCPVQKFKRRLAVNLYEEETGNLSKTDGHLELMERFIFALGISREELDTADAYPETWDLIDYRRNLVEDPSQYHKAAAAIMIASEGQSLEEKAGKMKHEIVPPEYGLTEHDLAFFTVHAAEDVGHVRDGLELVSTICTTRKMQLEAIEAVHETCDRFWRMADGVQRVATAQGYLQIKES
jgi:pyrroloquinoline-quinone synthase